MNKNTNAWEKIFKERGKIFIKPHEDMPAIVQALKDQGAKKILDLGSGSGRHVVYLTQNSFSLYGLDNSSSGLDMTRESAFKL